MPRQRSAFISYARHDRAIVGISVAMMRIGGVRVLWDEDGLKFGEEWLGSLEKMISASERVIVFWSAQAAASKWVRHEYGLALEHGKRVVPVVLDGTALPADLARLHGYERLLETLRKALRELKQHTPGLSHFGVFGPDDPLKQSLPKHKLEADWRARVLITHASEFIDALFQDGDA